MDVPRRTILPALLALALAPAASPAQEPDCVGPVGDARPGSRQWVEREALNAYCGEQRFHDLASNPAYLGALPGSLASPLTTGDPVRLQDPYRDPIALDGVRFRYDEGSFTDAGGKVVPTAVFRPLTDPGPDGYPAVVITHGGAANQEMYLWASEGLAEAGYLVLTFQVPNTAQTHTEDTRSALDFLLSERNPWRAQVDERRIGLAGHSAGGVAVNRVAHEDPRVDAAVVWDRAQSTPLPTDITLRTPSLFFVADFQCQRSPVCVPVVYADRPDPRGPGDKDEDFQRVQAGGVDAMKVALRAGTHLDFTQLPVGTGSRHGQAVAQYYTLAWFDRYLRDDESALGRLTADTFDASADASSISGGTWDAGTQRNVPITLAGMPVADRLSFHFRSAYAFAGGPVCEDITQGCG